MSHSELPRSKNTKKLQLSTLQMRLVDRVLAHWQAEHEITSTQRKALRNSLDASSFDWYRLAQYAFLTAVVCAIIAFASLLHIKVIVEYLVRIGALGRTILSGLIAIGFYVAGYTVARYRANNWFMSSALYLFAVVMTQLFVASLMFYLNMPKRIEDIGAFALAIIYAVIGFGTGSVMVWVFALLFLGAWFGNQSFYVGSTYVIGMRHPEVSFIYGMLLLALVQMMTHIKRFRSFLVPSFALALLYIFLSLWILSLSGGLMAKGQSTDGQLFWSSVLLIAASMSTWHGLRYDWALTRGFGLTFLAINLYTKFFEYFWSALPKTLFFIILAISFWLIGMYAESMLHRLAKRVKRI